MQSGVVRARSLPGRRAGGLAAGARCAPCSAPRRCFPMLPLRGVHAGRRKGLRVWLAGMWPSQDLLQHRLACRCRAGGPGCGGSGRLGWGNAGASGPQLRKGTRNTADPPAEWTAHAMARSSCAGRGAGPERAPRRAATLPRPGSEEGVGGRRERDLLSQSMLQSRTTCRASAAPRSRGGSARHAGQGEGMHARTPDA